MMKTWRAIAGGDIVHTTTQVCTVIGAGGLVLTMLIFAVSLGAVIIRDGSAAEVSTAMQAIVSIMPNLAIGAAALGGVVSASSIAEILTGRSVTATPAPVASPAQAAPVESQA